MTSMSPTPAGGRGRVVAVLGPTNTGKTYLAIERMLGHQSGMMGFPLRLLARENYDRVVRVKGRHQVALVTGEEKILPRNPRYFLCTVESMPVDRPVDFLAVDEIQLCADPERGHVFTDRLLHARGGAETMFLGSDTVRSLLKALVPEAEMVSRPRFSTLRYAGAKKLTRLPPRSAIVAFSAADVYATAELMRRNRGGTAVVLGALSPRTRNAQVEMFEAGEVDYLVATDAIGMGLNLDLDHVAFAQLRKFDGRAPRPLSATEVAQIAGRAGRHMSDGTFGTTGGLGDVDAAIVEAVENHRFDPVRALAWRSRDLDFRDPKLLLRSLERRPPVPQLMRGREADDVRALAALAGDPDVRALAGNPASVRLLWEVCQVPDFRKILSDHHTRLLGQIYRHLMRGERRLPKDWVAKQLAQIDRVDGDIDALMARIAAVRTWTYISHRGDWLADPTHWQERARAIEDRLSDALHAGLTQRFVDRRAAALLRRLQDGRDLVGAVRKGGEVLIEGESVGRLRGFHFSLDVEAGRDDARPLMAAARRALAAEVPGRLKRLERDDDGSFALDSAARITWRGEAVARLVAGAGPLRPKVEVLDSDLLDARQRERLRKRVAGWLERHQRNKLAPLYRLAEAELSGPARGLAFQLVESLGVLDRRVAAAQLRGLDRAAGRQLAGFGVRFGRHSIWLPALAKPAPRQLKALLAAVDRGLPPERNPAPSAPAFQPAAERDEALCRALGYRRLAGRGRRTGEAVALRVDTLERLAAALAKLGPQGPFSPTQALVRLAGGDRRTLALALPALGYRAHGPAGAENFAPPRAGGKPRKTRKSRARKPRVRQQSESARSAADSPFAKLRELSIAE